VTLAETTFTFTGEAKEPAVSSVVLDENALTATTDYTVSYSDNVSAGTATVTVTGQGIYTGEATTTFTINKAALSNLSVMIEGWTYGAYDEENNLPSVEGNQGEGEETYYYKPKDAADNSYTETVPTNAGAYTVKVEVEESDNYAAGSATADFNIAKANITPEVTIQGWTYGDAPNEPVVNGNLGNGTVTITYQGENDDEPTATVPTNAGGYTIFVSVAETANYNSASTNREFSIEKADFSQVVVTDIADQTYTGDPIEPAITVTFKGNPVDASEYEVDYGEDNVDVGTVTVTLTSNEINFLNGDQSVTKTFNIVAAGVEITAEDQTEIYNGVIQEFTNYEGNDFEVIALYYASEEDRETDENLLEVVINAGTYYVKLVSGDENYAFEPVYATFTIEPKPLTDDMLWTEGDEYVYDGNPQSLMEYGLRDVIDEEDVDLEEGEDKDFTVAYTNNTNVGTATATFTGHGNYKDTVTITFNIQRDLNLTFNEVRQWATYYAEEDLQIPEGMKAYIVTGLGENEVIVEEIEYIPQHVGILLTYEEAIPDAFLASAYEGATKQYADNLLQGTSTAKAVSSVTDGIVFVLFNNEFVKSTTGNIPANRAYLVLDDTMYGGPESRSLKIFIGDASGIVDFEYSTLNIGHSVYDLQGRRMDRSTLKKGLVIVNGKKFFVK
jgi:hypothetical protein